MILQRTTQWDLKQAGWSCAKRAETRLVIYPKAMMKGSEQMKASIVFECEDIFGTYEKMKTNGVEFLGEPNQMEWGTFVQFKDEDGNVFLLKE